MKNLLQVNLEDELLQENVQTTLTAYELLQIRQFETLGQLESNSVLQRLGMLRNLSQGKTLLEKINKFKQQTARFDSKRVFHVSQIEKICVKYRLKFLPTRYYNGQIEPNLPQKITNFELIYETEVTSDNSFIVAPKNSFRLEERPKDPLFFYQINDEYYYLIHKWGNDLSVFNRLNAILHDHARWLIFLGLLSVPVIFQNSQTSTIVAMIGCVCWSAISLADCITHGDSKIFLKFKYDSPYRV